MTPQLLERVFQVLDVVVFEQNADGAFVPLTAVPTWMSWLSRDGTFPFLGDFLGEAKTFWDRRSPGRFGSGLLAVDDPEGREFHVEVWAATVQGSRLLLFERPSDAEGLQHMLQRAREEVLARQDAERTSTRQAAALDELSTEVRTAVESIRRIIEAADQQRAGASRDIFLDAVRVVTETLAARTGVASEPS